ncbi:MAG: HAMP domain-containing histidine kinase [Crocinitomicaceae bacterium]|nr:HAMP domain-containing histidine kinase [Crocinitomicaceae bacterium]
MILKQTFLFFFLIKVTLGLGYTEKSKLSLLNIQNKISAGYLDKGLMQCNTLKSLHGDIDSYYAKRAQLLMVNAYGNYGKTKTMGKCLLAIDPREENKLIRYYWTEAFTKYCFLTEQPQIGINYLYKAIEIGNSIYDNDRVKFSCWINELFIIYYTEKIEGKVLRGKCLPQRAIELFENLKKNEAKMLPFELALYYSYQIYFANSLDVQLQINLSNKIIRFGLENDHPLAIIIGKLNLAKYSKVKEGIKVLFDAEKEASKIQAVKEILRVNYELMSFYKKLGDYDNALIWGRKALFPKEIDYSNYFDIYGQLSEIYERKGDVDSAFYYKKIDYDKYSSISKVHDDVMQSSFIDRLNKNINDKEYEIWKNQWFIVLLSVTSVIIIILTVRNMKFNKTLRSKNSLLKLNLQTTENFSHILSHDLRAPIHSIRNVSSHLIEGEKSLSEDGKELLGIIKECCESSILLITNIMTYIQSRKVKISFEPENIEELFKVVELNLSEMIEISGTRINYGDLPKTIVGNKILLIQLFQNVIQNSIKYRQEDTPMVLDITYEENASKACIIIKDTGVGICESQIENLLNAFTQKEFVSVNHGIGLGLSICSNIMKHHEGQLLIESKNNKGTTVKLQFLESRFN